MNCRDVRDVADSFLGEELLTETNHEILRHLGTCPSCRSEIEARRRLRSALRIAFDRAPDLQPAAGFADRLREQLRHAAAPAPRSRTFPGRWLALAAGLVLATGMTIAALLDSMTPADRLARAAIGDHLNCALKFRLVRMPVPLEEAAQRFDSAYRVLVSAPPDDISTPDGPARVVERHSCAYGARRFGHVILRYRGRVVSLLVTTNEAAPATPESLEALPHVIGQPMGELTAVSVNGSSRAVILVSDLGSDDLKQLAGIVSRPLVQRLGDATSSGVNPTAWLLAMPVQTLARDSGRRSDLGLGGRLPIRWQPQQVE
jgi:hypothetical protein